MYILKTSSRNSHGTTVILLRKFYCVSPEHALLNIYTPSMWMDFLIFGKFSEPVLKWYQLVFLNWIELVVNSCG